MNQSTIDSLSRKIDESILPLITSDYVLWGLPYYVNPGDTLIWEGTLEMLKNCPFRCLGSRGWDEYKPVQLTKDTVILILGGGYFGDVWRKAWDNVMETITNYPDNPIIILPQSIHYTSMETAGADSEKLSRCRHLTICARDDSSFSFARDHFTNPVILVPDLAFHVSRNKLGKWESKNSGKVLFLKRNDKELKDHTSCIEHEDMDITDWPLMQDPLPWNMKVIDFIYRSLKKRNRFPIFMWLEEKMMLHVQKRIILKESVSFISRYETVVTTRLHAMILGFLLDKNIHVIDNSYGKIGACTRTWLKDCKNITING